MTEGGEHELQAPVFWVRTFDGDIDVKLALPPICPETTYAKKFPSNPHKPLLKKNPQKTLLKSAHIRKDKKSFQLTREFV